MIFSLRLVFAMALAATGCWSARVQALEYHALGPGADIIGSNQVVIQTLLKSTADQIVSLTQLTSETLNTVTTISYHVSSTVNCINSEVPGLWDGDKCVALQSPRTVECLTNNCKINEANIVFVQDLTGSYFDDINFMRSQMAAVIADPSLQDAKVAMTSFKDEPSQCFIGAYASGLLANDYAYRIDMDLMPMGRAKNAILNTVANWSLGWGCDGPESQWVAVKQIIQRYKKKRNGLLLVINTDARPHAGGWYPSDYEIAHLMKKNNVHMIVTLGTDSDSTGAWAYYSSFFSNYGVKGIVVPMAANSSNFYAAFKEGLERLCEGEE